MTFIKYSTKHQSPRPNHTLGWWHGWIECLVMTWFKYGFPLSAKIVRFES